MKRKSIWLFWGIICKHIVFGYFFIFLIFKKIGFEKMYRMAVSSDMSFYLVENRQITFLILFYLVFLMLNVLLNVLFFIFANKKVKNIQDLKFLCFVFNILFSSLSILVPFLVVYNILNF